MQLQPWGHPQTWVIIMRDTTLNQWSGSQWYFCFIIIILYFPLLRPVLYIVHLRDNYLGNEWKYPLQMLC